MGKPLLLDLFCCEGGASAGYVRAGFDVLGIDITPQPRYPYRFLQADALGLLSWLIDSHAIRQFAAIHASPPCQRYSTLKSMTTHQYADLLAPTRELLMTSGLPWILENVATAPMHQGIEICGTALGLNVRRHRRFDSSHLLYGPGMCRHNPDNVNVYGHGAWNYRPRSDDPRIKHWTRKTQQCPLPVAAAKEAFEASWMTQHGLAECIPPAYTEFLGRQLLTVIPPNERGNDDGQRHNHEDRRAS